MDTADMPVHLPATTITILVIDTNAYTGNFDRQLCASATGLWDGVTHGEEEALDALSDNPGIVQRIIGKSMPLPHHDDGMDVVHAIRSTPGRVNDGMGVHMDADRLEPGRTPWPAYESIGVFLSEPLDDEEMAFVRRRAARFAAAPTAFGERDIGREPFAIRDIYQTTRTTLATETRLAG